MTRLFIEDEIINKKIEISGDNCHYIKNVVRLKEQDKLICIKNKKEFLCNIDKIEKNSIILVVEYEISKNTENKFDITLFQGIPKGDKFEFIIEKSVEVGVDKIVPLKLQRCIAKIEEKDTIKKLERYNKISKSAAQQSGRLIMPEVLTPIALGQIDGSKFDLKLVAYEDEAKTTLKQILEKNQDAKNIAIVIGPEGGIAENEIAALLEKGFISVSLGDRILRCETAGLYTIANINYSMSL
jgi:16S rRNA (uracil1498-N3)-methyltransferase